MNTPQAQKLILLSAVTVGGIEILKGVQTHKSFDARMFIGGGIAYTLMSGASEFAPGPAAAFASVVMLTVFLTDGGPVLSQLLGNGGPPVVVPPAHAKKRTTPTRKVAKK